jgi:glycosyltransferase involved in cell wall biosynthesis
VAQVVKIAFVTTAFNEEDSLLELYSRCRAAFSHICKEYASSFSFDFKLVAADNGSSDNSRSILQSISQADSAVKAIYNRANYGPEASASNALANAGEYDICALLCADLQDPPELVFAMVKKLLDCSTLDSVLAVKSKSCGSHLTRLARHSYYRALEYTSRFQTVPKGFHGFGCYRRDVIDEALRYWHSTDLNLRQCLVKASQNAFIISYAQAARKFGKSSYTKSGYFVEAWRSIIAGDAAASRLAFLIGGAGLAVAVVISLMLLLNYLFGHSHYSPGTPTLMAIVLFSSAIQLLMFSLLSRQLEALRMGGLRPTVRFSLYSDN